jgi:hypothetical protein
MWEWGGPAMIPYTIKGIGFWFGCKCVVRLSQKLIYLTNLIIFGIECDLPFVLTLTNAIINDEFGKQYQL